MANMFDEYDAPAAPATGGNMFDEYETPPPPPAPPVVKENNPVWTPQPSTPQPQVMGALPQWLTDMLPQRENVPAPVPEAMGAGPASKWAANNLVAPVVEGVVNTPRNLAETAEILAPEGSALKEVGRYVTKNVPEVNLAPEKGAVGEVVGAVAPIFIGGSGGLKLAGAAAVKVKNLINATSKTGKALSKGLTHVAKGIGFEAGGVAASDVDLGTGFVGPKSAFGEQEWNILRDWGFDEEGNPDEIRFEKKANQLIEGLTAAGLGDMAGKIVSKLWSGSIGPSVTSIKRGVVNLFSPDAATNQTMTDLVATMRNVDPDDPKMFDAAVDEMKGILADPAKRKVTFDFGEADPRLPTTEIKKGTIDLLEDDVAEKGFMGTGVENTNVDELIRLRQFENAVKGNKLAGEELQPNRALQNTLTQTREVFGGEGTVKPAAEGITSGLEEKYIRPAQEQFGGYRAVGEDAQQALVDALKSDPFFVEVAKDLTKYNPNVGKMSDDVGKNLVDRLFSNLETMTKEKNELFKMPILNEINGSPMIIRNAMAEIDRIDPTIIPKALRDRIGDGNLSIAAMDEIANFNVTDLIGAARNRETYRKADLLGKLKKALTKDQTDYLLKRKKAGDAAANKAIKAADDFYTKFLPWRTNPILSDVAESRWKDVGLQKPVETMRRVEQGIVESGTETGGSMYTDQMVDFIENQFKTGSEDVGVLVDFALTNIAKDAQKMINAGGKLDVNNAGAIRTALAKIGPLLQKADPIRYEQLLEFGDKLGRNAVEMEDIDNLIAGAKEMLEQNQDKVYNNIAKEFYSRIPDETRRVLPENYESFKQLFATNDTPRIMEMLDVIKDNPVAMDGVKSAYTKYLRDEYLSRAGTALDKSNLLNLNSLRELADPESAAFAQARMIYGDKYAENLRSLTEYVYTKNARTRTGKELGEVNPKAGEKESRMSVDKLITLVFGPLDRTGARLRTLTGQYVDSKNMSQYAKAFIDEVLANPQAFDDALEALKRSRAGMISAETKKMLKKSFYRGVFRRMGASDAPEPIDQQTEELFGTGEEGNNTTAPFPRSRVSNQN